MSRTRNLILGMVIGLISATALSATARVIEDNGYVAPATSRGERCDSDQLDDPNGAETVPRERRIHRGLD